MSIPTIDLTPLREGDAAARAQIAREVGAACEQIGFFSIVGHGVNPEVIARATAAGAAFFDLPVEQKDRLALGDGDGLRMGMPRYNGIEKEALAASLGEKTPPDLKESLGFGPEDLGRAWPDEPSDLEPALVTYFETMIGLGQQLRHILLEALGHPADLLDDLFAPDGGASYLRVLNYPERADALPGQMRAGAHTDYDCITILRSQDSAGGLQVQDRDGQWHDVQGIDDAFVVNIGDAMAVWSNDRFVSTLHRVVTPPNALVAGSRRQSLAFFYSPAPDTVLEAITTPGERAVHEPIRFSDLQNHKAGLAHGVAPAS